MAGNQYQADPRQIEFLTLYLDKDSETYSNALQSALKAGYSQEYAESITHKMPNWLAEKVGDEKLVDLAEKALLEALNYLTVDEGGKVDAGAARVKLDAAKLILKGLKKEKYSERQEHTGKDGGAIQYEDLSELSDAELVKLTTTSEIGTS